MAVLETIRVKFGIVITVLIAVALLSFIIDPTTLQSVTDSMSSKNDVGEINGKSISYDEFQTEVDKYTDLAKIASGSSVLDEQQQISVRNAAWQSLVDKYLFIENAKNAGFSVGDEEMLAIINGEIDSPIITQNPAFFDENGVFSKDALVQFINSIDSDASGSRKLYWDNVQSTVLTQQYYAKYMSLFTESNIVNKLQLTDQLAGNNNTFDVEFVMVPFAYNDTTVVVSDDEIKKYYNSHKKFYKQQAGRDIEYVVFEVRPSASDVEAANDALAKVYDEFTTTQNMKSFLLANSDRKFDNTWYKAGELRSVSAKINDFVFDGNASVSEVFSNGNTFSAVRVIEQAMVSDSVYVKYVPAASENVDSLLNVVEPMWVVQTPGYEDLMTAKPGSEVKLGGFVFKVLDRTKPVAKKRVAILEKNATASKATISEAYSKANTLATMSAGKYESFRSALDSLGLYAHPVSKMAEGTNRLGAIEGTKEISRWAFDEAEVGDVSSIFTINNDYFVVAAMTKVYEEGYADLSEVSSSIRNILHREKYAEKKAAEVKETIAGLTDLEAIADKLGIAVSTKEGVAFSSFSTQGLDPKFIGAASVAADNVVCGPIAGSNGVYVYKVTGRETQDFYTEESAKQHNAQRSQYSAQMLVPIMMQDADVKDNRARFF